MGISARREGNLVCSAERRWAQRQPQPQSQSFWVSQCDTVAACAVCLSQLPSISVSLTLTGKLISQHNNRSRSSAVLFIALTADFSTQITSALDQMLMYLHLSPVTDRHYVLFYCTAVYWSEAVNYELGLNRLSGLLNYTMLTYKYFTILTLII